MRTDVVIIGGGVIGSAIAYYLTKRGKKVILLEKKYLVNGSSGACDQGILLQSKAPNEHLVLGIYSLEMFKKLEQDLGRKLEFVQKGYLVLIESEPELKVMQEIVQKQNELGLPSKIITKEEALAMQPGLNPDAFVAAACCDWDGEVNPYMLTMAFADKAEELGAVIKTGCPVTGLVMEDGAVKGVETQEGTIYADTVVNAAGVWAPEIGAMAGLKIPITPRRGQAFITEAVPEFIHRSVINARYIVAKHHPEVLKKDTSMKAKLGVGLCLTQSEKGNVMFGATREFVGYDVSNTVDGLSTILSNAVHLVPGLKNLNIIRTMGGLRPYTPDGRPLIGYVDGVPGFFMAAGHEGDGISLAPATGKLVSDLIVDGKTEVPAAEGFDTNRFALK